MISRKVLYLTISSLSAVVLLSGCAQLNEYVETTVRNQAEIEIQKNDEYIQYAQYLSENLLDDNGVYQFATSETTDLSPQIPVTFAKNSFLECQYNSNNEEPYPIETEICYLAPGDSLYSSSVAVKNSKSNLYAFDKFRIWSFDSKGQRGDKPFTEVKSDSGLLLTIPEDYNGSGFAVEPIGVYSNREISVKAYYIDDSGQECPLASGNWTVGNKEIKKGHVSINPLESYTIQYNYSKYPNYYVVSSEPECWFINENEKTVIFQEASSLNEATEYSVCMHQYVNFTIKNECYSIFGTGGKGIITSISRGIEDLLQKETNTDSFNLPNLRVGDEIIIRVGPDYMITSKVINVGSGVPLGSSADDGWEYTIEIPDINDEIQINVAKSNSDRIATWPGYDLQNADLSLTRMNDNAIVKVDDRLPGDSDNVIVRIEPHSGYYLDGKNVENYSLYSKKMKFSEFQKNAEAIINDHPAIPYVSIVIDKQDTCGECTYKLDGIAITEGTINARRGQKIELEFKANSQYKIIRDGWVADKWSSLWGTDSISDTIEITADMNGMTITRANFNIQVEKVG